MSDSEKVIKDLEKIHTHFFVKYRGCGIKAEKAKYKERLSAVADAIDLLKEIEPVQSGVDADGVPHCGSCGWVQSYGCNYCDNCGKRLIWD